MEKGERRKGQGKEKGLEKKERRRDREIRKEKAKGEGKEKGKEQRERRTAKEKGGGKGERTKRKWERRK